MIEINMKIEICDSWTTHTLRTLSMISLEVNFVNIYYNIHFNNTANIIYRAMLQYLIVRT